MARRILFLNVPGSSNKGDISVIIGHITGLRYYMPNSEITIMSGNANVDKIYEAFGAKVLQHPWYFRRQLMYHKTNGWLWQRIKEKNRVFDGLRKVLSAFFSLPFIIRAFALSLPIVQRIQKKPFRIQDYDIILDTLPDRLNEPFHGSLECLAVLFITCMAEQTTRKPILLGPCSIGPLNSRFLKIATKVILNKTTLVAARDKATFSHLKQIGVCRSRVLLLADMAFLLPVVPKDRVTVITTGIGLTGKRPIVGIVTRMFFWESANNGHSEEYRANQYYDFVARFTDWLISRFGVQICLVPMETGSGTYWNDEVICLEIYNRMVQKGVVKIAPANLSPPELKGLFSCFELAVSWKLHGAVIATSCAVPTVALSYGEKFKSLFNEHLRLPELIINLNLYGYDALFSHLQNTFESTWQNREHFRVRLRDRTAVLSKLALSYSQHVCEIINATDQSHDT